MSVAQLQNSYLNTSGSAPAVQSFAEVAVPGAITPSYVLLSNPTSTIVYPVPAVPGALYVGNLNFTILEPTVENLEYSITVSGVAYGGVGNTNVSITVFLGSGGPSGGEPAVIGFCVVPIAETPSGAVSVSQHSPFTFTCSFSPSTIPPPVPYPLQVYAQVSSAGTNTTPATVSYSSSYVVVSHKTAG